MTTKLSELEFEPVDMTDESNWSQGSGLDEYGEKVGAAIVDAIREFDESRPRNSQRALGMSSLGGCREYIRATVAGEERVPGTKPKWAANVGTAVGDYIEGLMMQLDGRVRTQEYITYTTPNGIKATGSADIMTDNLVIDLKSKDGLGEVRRYGPSLQHKIQLFGYLKGAIQNGTLPPEATGHLVYVDRSGKDASVYVWSTTADNPQLEEIIAQRLQDVAVAITTSEGQGILRDEPTNYCMRIECPFRMACWKGYIPETELTHPKIIQDVKLYTDARAEKKQLDDVQKAVKVRLSGTSGRLPDGTVVSWTIRKTRDGDTEQIDIREP
jgi:hypothetical protein